MATSRLQPAWQRFVHAAKKQITLMSADEQTRLSWAKPVRAIDEIPVAYHETLRALLPGLQACLPAVLTPTFRGFMRRENEKLVFTYAERLYILEQTATEVLTAIFSFDEINAVEVGAILLKAWLRVSGLVGGELKSATLKYNTVTQYLFDPLVAEIRSTLSDSPGLADPRQERAKFEPLQAQHFKFMNYARMSLQPGERVIAYTLQPEMRTPRMSLLGKPLAMRTIDTAHLVVLTDSELIVIRDDPNSVLGCDDTRYGGIWDYLPLSRVRHAALEERPSGPALTLRLPGDEHFEVLFSPEHRLELEGLCRQIGTRIPIQPPN